MHNDASVRKALMGIRASQVRTQLLESGFALCAAPGREITKNSLGFHNPDVGLFGDGDQIIGGISFDQSAIAPVVRHPYLVHVLSVDEQRAHPSSDKGSRLDEPARSRECHPAAVFYSALLGQLRRYFAEELGLQFSKMRKHARHRAGGVVLGQAVCAHHKWEPSVGRICVLVLRPLFLQYSRIALYIRIEWIANWGLQGFVVGW